MFPSSRAADCLRISDVVFVNVYNKIPSALLPCAGLRGGSSKHEITNLQGAPGLMKLHHLSGEGCLAWLVLEGSMMLSPCLSETCIDSKWWC